MSAGTLTPGRSSRAAILFAAAAVLVCALAAAATYKLAAPPKGPQHADDAAAVAAGKRFLDSYMAPDGRVVRRDQGGDTVSEGQAYAMLVAAGIGDERRFRLAWDWAREHLRRDDGLLSYLWARGRVTDPQPATDADLDAARALVLGATIFADPRLRAEGDTLARAILEREVVHDGARALVVAGPWARERRVVNPSYLSPRAYGLLANAGAGGDRAAWSAVARESSGLVRDALSVAPFLPPDWARVADSGRLDATSPPSHAERPATYGLDAQRVPIRFAESCTPDDRRLAASTWPFLREHAKRLALGYELDGARPRGGEAHPLGYVAAAAAASAAGDPAQRDAMLAAAAARERAAPSYYGAAWVALGRLMLTTRRLGGCAV